MVLLIMKFPLPNIASRTQSNIARHPVPLHAYPTGYSSLDIRHQVLHYVKQQLKLQFIFEYPH
jgi:hypothetical protein